MLNKNDRFLQIQLEIKLLIKPLRSFRRGNTKFSHKPVSVDILKPPSYYIGK